MTATASRNEFWLGSPVVEYAGTARELADLFGIDARAVHHAFTSAGRDNFAASAPATYSAKLASRADLFAFVKAAPATIRRAISRKVAVDWSEARELAHALAGLPRRNDFSRRPLHKVFAEAVAADATTHPVLFATLLCRAGNAAPETVAAARRAIATDAAGVIAGVTADFTEDFRERAAAMLREPADAVNLARQLRICAADPVRFLRIRWQSARNATRSA